MPPTFAPHHQQFINMNIKDNPEAKHHAMMPFDWDTLKGSKLYDRRLRGKINRNMNKAKNDQWLAEKREERMNEAIARGEYGLLEDPSDLPLDDQVMNVGGRRKVLYDDWNSGPAERSRRIWEWWKIRCYEHKSFEYFGIALQMVVLKQLSSADMERVFSVWVSIVRRCGVSMKALACKARIFSMINKDHI